MYYDSLSFVSSEDTPSMDIVALLANVGGTLGLFLGISVLSLFEALHVLVEVFLSFERSSTYLLILELECTLV